MAPRISPVHKRFVETSNLAIVSLLFFFILDPTDRQLDLVSLVISIYLYRGVTSDDNLMPGDYFLSS